ncbi:enoyl-CoA hydratase/isomerase family protein [Streptomyces sp. NBC_01571]|uniref:enoyl-CoA hydratase/isomerase family protein n=1 Tax=Streptomyces sp. NBC_01571 TaxID=2975883 RepID=UPI0022507BCA|nr:enoyl-CoA hydratase/isomerase family protein [Streptomyces sp. NBC_01571]MCX4579940.1 enoyl-CoA hydratase/isomerase family protein [Streptomyces sp. NBC_01571]
MPATYSYETIRTELRNGVLWATIDNPPVNLIDERLVTDLVALLDSTDTDGDVRVVVFRSADPDFFISHVDLKRIPQYTAAAATSGGPDDVSLGALFRRLSEARPVTIALLGGRARGAGAEFLYACDMRFASLERAVIGQIEVGTGVFTGAGAVQHLVRLAGRGQAMQMILSSEDVDAREAERIGVVNKALPDGELSSYVERLAERIAKFPEAAVRLAKRRINAAGLPPKEDVHVDGSMFQVLAGDGAVAARVGALMQRGLQERSHTELELGTVIGEL